jgi:hypothetical protein
MNQSFAKRVKPTFIIAALFIGAPWPDDAIYQGAQNNPSQEMNRQNQEVQLLSASNHATTAESFVFVARDSETYALLRGAVTSLPEQPADFFDSHAVIGVFLGQRPTGGYNIEISLPKANSIKIAETKPRQGAMLKMVLSSPHKVVAIHTKPTEPLSFDLDETWQQKLRPYKVTQAQVVLQKQSSGKRVTIILQGRIKVMRVDKLVTLWFDLRRLAGNSSSKIFDVVSAKMKTEDRIQLTGLHAVLNGEIQGRFGGVGEFANQKQALILRLKTSGASASNGTPATVNIKADAEPFKPTKTPD